MFAFYSSTKDIKSLSNLTLGFGIFKFLPPLSKLKLAYLLHRDTCGKLKGTEGCDFSYQHFLCFCYSC